MRLSLVAAVLVLSGCSAMKASRVRDDWTAEHANKVKRVTVVIQPLPDGQQKAGEAWARIVRRYVNMKRNFLVRAELVQDATFELPAVCIEGTEAVLWIKPTVRAKQFTTAAFHPERGLFWSVGKREGFSAEIEAKLVRCGDGLELWSGETRGSFEARDSKLIEVSAIYGQEYGPEVEQYVPLAMNALRPLLDTLPDPVLTKDEEEEKVLVDE